MGQLGKQVLGQTQAGDSLWARWFLGHCPRGGEHQVSSGLTAQCVNARKDRRCQQPGCSQSPAGFAPQSSMWLGWLQDRTGAVLASCPFPGLWAFSSTARPGRLDLAKGQKGSVSPPASRQAEGSDETSLSLQPSDMWPGVLILKEHRRKWDLAPCASSGEPDELGLQYTTKAVRVCNTPASLPRNFWPWLP